MYFKLFNICLIFFTYNMISKPIYKLSSILFFVSFIHIVVSQLLFFLTRSVPELCSCIAIRVCFICVFDRTTPRTHVFLISCSHLTLTLHPPHSSQLTPLSSLLLNSSTLTNNNKKANKSVCRVELTSNHNRNIRQQLVCEHEVIQCWILVDV